MLFSVWSRGGVQELASARVTPVSRHEIKPPGPQKGNICRRGHRVQHPGRDSSRSCQPPSPLGNNHHLQAISPAAKASGPRNSAPDPPTSAARKESPPAHSSWAKNGSHPSRKVPNLVLRTWDVGRKNQQLPDRVTEPVLGGLAGTEFARRGYTGFSKQGTPGAPAGYRTLAPAPPPKHWVLPRPIVPQTLRAGMGSCTCRWPPHVPSAYPPCRSEGGPRGLIGAAR